MDIELTLEEIRQDYVEAQVLAYLDELREQEFMSAMLTYPGYDECYDCYGTFRWDSCA
jgi:hypothetical protein